MSAPVKGHQTKNKSGPFNYISVEQVTTDQFGMSVNAYAFVELMASDAAEAGSTNSTIVATAHVAMSGDKIRFTSGANSGLEKRVDSVDANDIYLIEDMPNVIGVGDTFDILRSRTPTVSNTGGLSVSSLTQFTLDGVTQTVIEDTVTPANNRPLPVKLTGITGDVTVTAQNLNVQLTDQGATPDVTRLGDGTNQLAFYVEGTASAGGEIGIVQLGVRNDAGISPVSADGDFHALQFDNLGNLRTTATVAEQAIQVQDAVYAPGNLKMSGGVRQDAAGSPVSADGDVHPLVFDNAGQLKVAATFNEVATFAIDSAFVPASLSKLVSGIRQDAAGSPVSADGDVHPLVFDNNGQLKVAATFTEQAVYAEDSAHVSGDIGKFALAVRNDAGTSMVSADGDYAPLQVTSTGALRVSASIASSSLTVVDFLDVPFFDATTINGSAGAFVQCVASLAANVSKVQVFDTSGSFMGVYVGPPAGEVLAFVFGPGTNETVEIVIPAASRVSLRSLEAAAPVAGNITMNFIG